MLKPLPRCNWSMLENDRKVSITKVNSELSSKREHSSQKYFIKGSKTNLNTKKNEAINPISKEEFLKVIEKVRGMTSKNTMISQEN